MKETGRGGQDVHLARRDSGRWRGVVQHAMLLTVSSGTNIVHRNLNCETCASQCARIREARPGGWSDSHRLWEVVFLAGG